MIHRRRDGLVDYYRLMVAEGLWTTEPRLRFYTEFLFRRVPLAGRSVLDIGGGTGVFSFFATANGASRVVCLEPDGAGSTKGQTAKFARVAKALGRQDVMLVPQTLQEFDSGGLTFDVVLMHNSVNHIDEWSCSNLTISEFAVRNYQRIFFKLAELVTEEGCLILADCSPRNLYPLLGLKNPFARSIEWHKHQPPEVWIGLLQDSGFADPEVCWSTFNCLGRGGRVLLSNRFAAFFLTSGFCLRMKRAQAQLGQGEPFLPAPGGS